MLDRYQIQPSSRFIGDLVGNVDKGDLDLDTPYQRGSVWTEQQRRDLIKSLLIGLPIAAIVINQRGSNGAWRRNNGPLAADQPFYACIDGKQRLTAVKMWMDDELAVPRIWFNSTWVLDAVDGEEVRYSDLTEAGRRITSNMFLVPVAVASLGTLAQEAEVYRLLNTTGTPHTAEELARAAAVEQGGL